MATAEMSGYPYDVQWSPSGEWLAWKSATQDGGRLEAMRADGSGRQELTSVPGYGTGSISVIGWAGDEKLLAAREEQSNSKLLEFDLAGRGNREA